MSDKPTGVFVRLPLSEDEAHVFHKESSHAWDEFNGSSNALACEAGLFAIGTPVTGGDIPVIGTIRIGENGNPFFTSPELHSVGGDVVRQSDAQAALVARYHAGWVAGKRDAHLSYTRKIAALEAEVVRLREENDRLHRIAYSGKGSVTQVIHSPTRFMKPDLKGGAA